MGSEVDLTQQNGVRIRSLGVSETIATRLFPFFARAPNLPALTLSGTVV